MNLKKAIGLIILLIAVGMFLMLIVHNRLIGFIIIVLLVFVGYYCFFNK